MMTTFVPVWSLDFDAAWDSFFPFPEFEPSDKAEQVIYNLSQSLKRSLTIAVGNAILY